ncbi:MAG TPA: UvrD-helicase domain-containing protein [Thermodesulfobacteriota bacterium]|nr:UvrD-helicase domain-containing protein [Thermodesulfobacteriota bacterium]
MSRKNIGIEAGAGCGKTTRLTRDIITGLEQGDFSLDTIAVITFTRKAAAELKARISFGLRSAIENGKAHLEQQLRELGSARISTIHSFCEGLLKERPVEAGIDPGFTVLDENDQNDFFNTVFDEWLTAKLAEDSPFLRTLVLDLGMQLKSPESSYQSDRSLQGLISSALFHRELELFCPDDPGDAREMLAQCIADCEKMNRESVWPTLSERMEEQVQQFREVYSDTSDDWFSNIDILKLGNRGGSAATDLRHAWKDCCKDYQKRIAYAGRFPHIQKLYAEARTEIGGFIDYYRESMRRQGSMDFHEILCRTELMLAHNREVRAYFKEKFSCIFVDEFQDTDPLQTRILFFLAERPDHCEEDWEDIELQAGKLYVVGDPKQSIFRFRRADIEAYAAAINRIAGNGKQFLSTNYRSLPGIIRWVNTFFQERIRKPHDGTYQADYVSLEEHRTSGGAVLFVEPAGESSDMSTQKKESARDVEAKLTACWIRQAVETGTFAYGDIMVLFKTKKNMDLTARYLEEFAIPCDIAGASSYFARPEIHEIAHLLTSLANPLDQVSVLAALKGPFFSLSDQELYEWRLLDGRFDYLRTQESHDHAVGNALQELAQLRSRAFEGGPAPLLADLLTDKGILASTMASYRGEQKVYNLVKAMELLKSFGPIPFVDAADRFRQQVDREIEMPDFSPQTRKANAVQLMTIHKAKGLEQKVVYIADATSENTVGNATFIDSNGGRIIYLIPGEEETLEYLEWKEQEKLWEQAEVERLRYVAATRAQELLVINRIPYRKSENAFAAPFADKAHLAETVHIDLSGVALTPQTHERELMPCLSPTFSRELQAIKESVAAAIDHAARPSIDILSPSLAAGSSGDLKVEVLYGTSGAAQPLTTSSAQLGSLAHKLLEVTPIHLETAARTLIKNERSDIFPEQLLTVCRALHKEQLQERLARAKAVFREVPIKFKAADGFHYDGVIDLLFEEQDGWVLVDYKAVSVGNDSEAQTLADRYRNQLELYAEGLGQLGLTVKDCLLVSC